MKGSTRFLRLPHPPFPFENILFHWAISCLSPCVISSFSIQTPPPLLANICVVTGGEILEPVVYFRIKKTSSMPTLLPSYAHTHTQLCLFLVKFSRASLCHKRQQMPLSPYQIRAGRRQEWRETEARARHMSLGRENSHSLPGTNRNQCVIHTHTPGLARWNNMSLLRDKLCALN